MTDLADSPHPGMEQAQVWATRFSEVLAQIRGSALPCASLAESPAGLQEKTEADLWILCALTGGLRGELSFRLPSASTLRLAQIFMSEPAAPEAALSAEHREAVLELLRQVGGLVATSLAASWGEVQVRLDAAAAAPSWPAASTAWIRIGEESAPEALLEILLSAALQAALRSEKSTTTETSAPPPAAPEAAPSAPAPSAAVAPDPNGLHLLMEVELGIILRFGSRKMLLKDVLDLNAGAVVDLDRQIQEPVDMLLDGRLLARGEIVVMDGNYGLRVTEVAPAYHE